MMVPSAWEARKRAGIRARKVNAQVMGCSTSTTSNPWRTISVSEAEMPRASDSGVGTS